MATNKEELEACAVRFIKAVLCGNPILKSTMLTFLNGIVVTASAELVLLVAQLGRLNIVNAYASAAVLAYNAAKRKIQSEFNVVSGPMQAITSCPPIAKLLEGKQSKLVGKYVVGFENLLYNLNRRSNLIRAQTAAIKEVESYRDKAQAFIDKINEICP